VARGERVLVASQTNTAVDNVIERLPPSMTAIRVGNEERISEAVLPRTLAAVAGHLQHAIVERTETAARRLEPWIGIPGRAAAWFARMTTALGESAEHRAEHRAATAGRDAATAGRDAATAVVTARFAEPIRRLEHRWQAAHQAALTAERQVGELSARLRRAETSPRA
jgi:hypothetical protein